MFWMELNGHKGQLPVSDTFIGAVIDVGEPGDPIMWQRLGVHRKAVVLRGDVASLGSHQKAGLILTSVAVFEFIGVGSCG